MPEIKTFAEKNIWSQPDTARRFPVHSCDTISALRNPMKSITFDSPIIRVLPRISLLQCMWGDSRIKLGKPCQDLQTPLLSWSWAWPISVSMVLFHWSLGIPNNWSLFDITWLLNVAFHSTTWCASWSHDSSGNPASRLVYPGYEVRTAGWHHQHIHQCGAQWHNQ